MKWNDHSMLEGKHAYLSASKYHWINYTDEKLSSAYRNHLATLMGTRLHAYAAECISLGQKLPRSHKTLNMYVNDAIGFGMTPEQILRYSDNCFGTADAIKFENKKGHLRIHDLKTGIVPAHMEQLDIYAALFCLEYGKQYNFKPGDIEFETRIYQNDDVWIENPTVEDIFPIMDTIIQFDKIIERIKEEG